MTQKVLLLLLAVCLTVSNAAPLANSAPVTKTALLNKLAVKLDAQTEKQAVQVSWDASNETSIKGYNLYFGAQTRVYYSKEFIDVKESRNVIIKGMGTGTPYFFAVTSIGIDGIESEFSDEVRFVGGYITRVQKTSTGAVLTIEGVKDWQSNIAISGNNVKWRLLKVVQNKSGLFQVTVPNPENVPRAFWLMPSDKYSRENTLTKP